MSASNGGMRNDGETFFSATQQPFPELSPDGQIDTVEFLEAAKGVVALVDMFGKTFAPVKLDMDGNVKKLTKQYNKNLQINATLHEMIKAEKQEGKNFATEALLWLKRGLHFFQVFLQCLLQDAEDGKNTENLSPFLKEAYSTTLERYHGWMSQQLFSVLAKMCPYRKDILATMSLGYEGRESAVFRDMVPFVQSLQRTVTAIDDLYRQLGLDLEVKA